MDPKCRYFVPRATSLSLLPYGKVLHDAGKGIVGHKRFLDGWEKLLSRMFWYNSLFMAVFFSKLVSETTHASTREWSQDALLLA